MRSFALVSCVNLVCILVCFGASDGLARVFSQTVRADSTMDGNVGFIVRAAEPGFPLEDAFVFVEAGKYRVYAIRVAGTPWEILIPARYFAPVASMTIGQTWRAEDTDLGQETMAEVRVQEQVTVAAGTFTCFRIDVTTATIPFVIESFWLSDGVGLVKEKFWEGNGYGFDELSSFSVTGTGFFPSNVGNQWSYSDAFVPVENSSWGAIKSLYR